MADTHEHLANLVRLALADHHPPPGVCAGGRGPDEPNLPGDDPLPIEHGAALQPLHGPPVGDSPHLDDVLPQHTVPRVGNPQRQLPVVGEQHQPLGVEVETPDREDPLRDLAPEVVEDGRPPFGIVGGGHDLRRFVEQERARRLGGLEAFAVDLDGIPVEVGLTAERRHLPVDGDAALADQDLCVAARADPGARDELLDPLTCH